MTKAPYAVPVNRSLETVEEAFAWLMPKIVKEAIAAGLKVPRQGDWFFIPTEKRPRGNLCNTEEVEVYIRRPNGSYVHPAPKMHTLYNGAFLVYTYTQTRHWGSQVYYLSIKGLPGPAPLVKGKITAPEHKPLYLGEWHIAVRNRSTPHRNIIRTAGDD